MFKPVVLVLSVILMMPAITQAAEVTIFPSITLQIGDRDSRGHFWDGDRWRDRTWWDTHYEWHDRHWQPRKQDKRPAPERHDNRRSPFRNDRGPDVNHYDEHHGRNQHDNGPDRRHR